MIDIESNGLDGIIADFGEMPAVTTRAAVRAMNRSIKSGHTLMARLMAQDTGLPVGMLKEAMPISEANASRLEARFGASLKRIPLGGAPPNPFKVSGPMPSRGKGRGVTYRLGGSRNRIDHAFRAQMTSGHVGVFERTPGKFMRLQKPTWKHKRQAIHEKFGPSLGQVFKKHRDAGITRALEVFQSNFDHEMGFAKTEAVDAGAD